MNYRQLSTARSKRPEPQDASGDAAREIEVEVLRPGEKAPRPLRGEAPAGGTTLEDPFIALVATLMDSLFRIPGTKIRFGLDPIIGLLPGIGDAAASVTSLLLILQSARQGLPRVVLARMILNVLVNAGVGVVPFVGDLFSVWFRSNERNYDLHRKHAGARTSTKSDWLFILALIGGVLLVLAFAIGSIFAWSKMLSEWLK